MLLVLVRRSISPRARTAGRRTPDGTDDDARGARRPRRPPRAAPTVTQCGALGASESGSHIYHILNTHHGVQVGYVSLLPTRRGGPRGVLAFICMEGEAGGQGEAGAEARPCQPG